MKPRDAIEFHQALAPEWEQKYQKASFQSRDSAVMDLLSRNSQKGQHWLDAGCGSGRFTRLLASRGATALGVDAAAGMVEAASRLSSTEDLAGKLQFRQIETIARLGLPDACLDGVLCNSVLEYLPDPDVALAEMVRVLKPGGSLLISVPNRRSVFRQALVATLRLTRWLGHPKPAWLVHSVNEYRDEDFGRKLESLGLRVQPPIFFGGTLPAGVRRMRLGGSLMFFECFKRG